MTRLRIVAQRHGQGAMGMVLFAGGIGAGWWFAPSNVIQGGVLAATTVAALGGAEGLKKVEALAERGGADDLLAENLNKMQGLVFLLAAGYTFGVAIVHYNGWVLLMLVPFVIVLVATIIQNRRRLKAHDQTPAAADSSTRPPDQGASLSNK